ncbi:MAG TPA: FRG domain-containing protein [Thermoanaerobaculia bacterium]|nr:FRG domain-containing protein [Thermoanaerobaculia bacterium]
MRRYDTWEEFKANIVVELFGRERFRRGRFIFRGQRNAEWHLDTSFDRNYPSLNNADRGRVADELLDAFRNALSEQGLLDDMQSSEFVALAQHHGLPTRLLDWSESPYIAAYFAFSGALLSREMEAAVSVWVLDTASPIWGEESGVTIMTARGSKNQRLRNQYGRFTLSKTPFRTLEEYVTAFDEKANDDHVPLRQIIIPASETIKALSDLDVMGINSSRLFPDVSGCARNARMRIAIRTLDQTK